MPPDVRKWRESKPPKYRGPKAGARKARAGLTAADLAEEVMHLVVWCGMGGDEAAMRLGVSKSRLEAVLQQAREAA